MKPDHVPIARLASLIVFAVACSSGITELPARSAPIQAIDVPAGGFPLSITAAPAKDVGSWEQYLAAYELADELGFNPAITVEEGVSKFVDWYRSYYKDTL